MLYAKDAIKVYIEAQGDKQALADRLKISRQTLYNIIGGNPVSEDTASALLKETGFEQDVAFELIIGS